jgi:hypothetical protein
MLELSAMETTATQPASAAMPVSQRPANLVLEIGGGHNPYPQSDVIVDKYMDNKERGGDLKVDRRPVVLADFQQLPFKNGSFRHAICSHVLEHVEDVGAAIGELTRVAESGYLETPSALTEVVEPHRDYHRWYIAREGSKLIFYPKQASGLPQQFLLNRLISDNFAFKLFFLANPDLANMRLHWKKKIEYQVMPTGAPLNLDPLYPMLKQGPAAMAVGFIRHYLGKARRRVADRARAKKAPADILAILCCPVCKSSFRVDGDRLICEKCAGYYRRKGQFFHLLRENLTPL